MPIHYQIDCRLKSTIRETHRSHRAQESAHPLSPLDDPDEPSDIDDSDLPSLDDESRWDVFIPDDDEFDPLPDPGDFWTTAD